MKITRIAQTSLSGGIFDGPGVEARLGFAIEEWMEVDESSMSDADDLIEFAGRGCYESFHKPREATRANEDYVANILRQKHESVLEHASVSHRVEGVSRNMLLELERHRHLSFSVLSQRFVDSSQEEFIIPPALRDLPHLDMSDAVDMARQAYQIIADALQSEEGLTRKQAREAARAYLPGGVETRFVVTGNLRAWRDVLKKRYSTHADAEIRLFATLVLEDLRKYAPSAFQDFPKEPFNE